MIGLRRRFNQFDVIGAVASLDVQSARGHGRQDLESLVIEFVRKIEQNLNPLGSFRMKLTGIMFQILGINHNRRTSHTQSYHLGRHAAKQPASKAVTPWLKGKSGS
jgi:hypothetical protein